jgi:hypothetical protein
MQPEYSVLKLLDKSMCQLRESSAQVHGSLGSVDMLLSMMGQCTYLPVHLITQSFVPEEIYKVYGEKSLWFIDFRVTWTADAISEYFNTKITANDWHEKGKFNYRGFRPPSVTMGAIFSQHRFGRALDCDLHGVSAIDARKEILSHKDDPAFRYITCIEDNVNWLHFDCRNTKQDGILIVQP